MHDSTSLFKSVAIGAIGLLTPAIVFAQSFTLGIPEGSYKGRFRAQDRGPVHMLTQKIKGSQASFIAIIFKRQKGLFQSGEVKVEAYKALPTQDAVVGTFRTATQYTLTPIAADGDGELTTPNDNPSLVLNVTDKIGTREVEFTVVSAQSNNRPEFGTMTFKGNESPFDLEDGDSGELKRPLHFREEGTVSVISENPEDGSRAAHVTWNGTGKEDGGTFYLKEKAPGVFTFTGISFLATGTQPQPAPKKLVLFVKRGGDTERALLVDPGNSANVRELRIK